MSGYFQRSTSGSNVSIIIAGYSWYRQCVIFAKLGHFGLKHGLWGGGGITDTV